MMFKLTIRATGVAMLMAGVSVPCVAWSTEAATPVEAVVVEASKRSRSAETLDGQIAVIAAERVEAANIRSLDQLDRIVPGLSIRQRGARVYDNVTLRGQSSPDFYNPSSQVYVDGLPQDQASLGQLLPDDLQQVEVLYGPQGTLYGKGAVGGVINIVTRKPGEVFGGAASAAYGTLDRDIAGRLSVPLVSGKLFADLTLGYQDDHGEYQEPTGRRRGDNKDRNGRVRLRYAPDDSRWDVMATYGRERITSDEEQYVPAASVGSRTIFPVPTGYRLNLERAGVVAAYRLDGAGLTSATGYQDRDLDRTVFGTYSPETQKTFSQEVRIASDREAARLSYVAGAAYSDTEFTFARPGFGQAGAQQIRTTALFGEATLALADRWNLTGGLRWEHHDVEASATFATTTLTGSDDFSAVSPKIVLGFQVTPNVRLYGLISTGFKAGGFTRLATPANVAFAYGSEKVRNYEAGVNAGLLDGRVRVSAAAYLTRNEDYQLYVGAPPNQYLQNVGEAESKGVTVSLQAAPTQDLMIDGNVAINHAEFTKYDNPTNPSADLSGNRLPFAPHLTANLGAQYRFVLPGGLGSLTPRAEMNHVGRYYFDETNGLSQRAYTLWNASLAWNSEGPLSLSAYLNNIGDKTYAHYGFNAGPGFDVFQLGRGREGGVRLRARF